MDPCVVVHNGETAAPGHPVEPWQAARGYFVAWPPLFSSGSCLLGSSCPPPISRRRAGVGLGTSPVALVRFCRPGPWIRSLANHSVGVWGCLRVPVRQRSMVLETWIVTAPLPPAPRVEALTEPSLLGAGSIGTALSACRVDLG